MNREQALKEIIQVMDCEPYSDQTKLRNIDRIIKEMI